LFSVLINAWRVKDLRKKILYMLLIVAIYRIGCHIYLPGIDPAAMAAYTGADQNIAAAILGGNYATIFAMGIGPYITASIIMQLLTVAIPKLEQIQKEGEEGRKKINQYTRVVAVALALLQAAGTVSSYRSMFMVNTNTIANAASWQVWLVYITATVTLVTGTIFVMWLSELLTERGIGNGSSIIIFSNILSGFRGGVYTLLGQTLNGEVLGYVKLVAVVLLFVGIIAFVCLVQSGERRISVQYSKKMVGRQMYGGQSSFIPIKVNIAGVMSIIFAISLLQFPSTISQFWNPPFLQTLVENLQMTSPIGAVLYMFLIFCFTFFYTSFAINPIEMAENMKKNGGFIPGIRPGKPTSDYIQKTVDRLSWIGAFFYMAIALIPLVLQWTLKITVGFGGTTLLIITGVALEIAKQLESQLLMRHYDVKGFLD